MNEHALRVLEFHGVQERLASLATSVCGKELAQALSPISDRAQITRLLQQTTEARALLEESPTIPLGGIHDVRSELRTALAHGLLQPEELIRITDTLRAAGRLSSFIRQRRQHAPSLADLAEGIPLQPELVDAIGEAISDSAEIKDTASRELARVRKQLRVTHKRRQDKLEAILRNPEYRDMIQDPIITTRDGRECIPVKSEFRAQFGGLIHDQSASGATVFMEPAAVVELGNTYRQAQIVERQEIERILRELTAEVGAHAEEITQLLEMLGEVDCAFARGQLSIEMGATNPKLVDDPILVLEEARHPLLEPPVVPIDVRLGRDFTALVVTGPNTGGKTVTLKTVGLLVFMAQSGLHIPALPGSVMGIFEDVFADIGDEQSIEQSLSTFSGHITQISEILEAAEQLGSRALILLDEVGAGTDPAEGAALAKAILTRLVDLDCRVMATTHYGELKAFAYSRPGVENASVEFDLETLRPTYRLLLGMPGESNAFAIAARLGLSQTVLDSARGMVGTDQATLANALAQLADDHRAIQEDREVAQSERAEAEKLRRKYEQELRRLARERDQDLREARREADRIVIQVRSEMERLLTQARDLEKQARESHAAQREMSRTRQQLRDLQKQTVSAAAELLPDLGSSEPTTSAPEFLSAPPAVGDTVWVPSLNQRGQLLKLGGKQAEVQIGSMRMTVPAQDLQSVAPPPALPTVPAKLVATKLRATATATTEPEIHLRGMRVDEALLELDRYLDAAMLAGLREVRIVHGKGTGALRQAVTARLADYPHVGRARVAPREQGGDGVTLVELMD